METLFTPEDIIRAICVDVQGNIAEERIVRLVEKYKPAIEAWRQLRIIPATTTSTTWEVPDGRS